MSNDDFYRRYNIRPPSRSGGSSGPFWLAVLFVVGLLIAGLVVGVQALANQIQYGTTWPPYATATAYAATAATTAIAATATEQACENTRLTAQQAGQLAAKSADAEFPDNHYTVLGVRSLQQPSIDTQSNAGCATSACVTMRVTPLNADGQSLDRSDFGVHYTYHSDGHTWTADVSSFASSPC